MSVRGARPSCLRVLLPSASPHLGRTQSTGGGCGSTLRKYYYFPELKSNYLSKVILEEREGNDSVDVGDDQKKEESRYKRAPVALDCLHHVPKSVQSRHNVQKHQRVEHMRQSNESHHRYHNENQVPASLAVLQDEEGLTLPRCSPLGRVKGVGNQLNLRAIDFRENAMELVALNRRARRMLDEEDRVHLVKVRGGGEVD